MAERVVDGPSCSWLTGVVLDDKNDLLMGTGPQGGSTFHSCSCCHYAIVASTLQGSLYSQA